VARSPDTPQPKGIEGCGSDRIERARRHQEPDDEAERAGLHQRHTGGRLDTSQTPTIQRNTSTWRNVEVQGVTNVSSIILGRAKAERADRRERPANHLAGQRHEDVQRLRPGKCVRRRRTDRVGNSPTKGAATEKKRR
jgi:hypothetical protein